MKTILLALLVAAVPLATPPALAAGTNDPATELRDLVAKINADIHSGKRTETALADDIKQFDNLLAEHKGEKTDAVANILYAKATLYRQVIGDAARSDDLVKQLIHEFKGTEFAANIEKMEERHAAASKAREGLVAGAAFPDFNEKDIHGNPISAASHKGKILLIDFWATWCGPCRLELPNVIATYATYHDQGFDIISVSLDEDRTTLENFLKENKMDWPQFFDGKAWDNKLAVKYGIESIPAMILLDGQGKIIGKDLRGKELTQAVAKALGK